MTDLQELTNRVVAFRDARDWKQFHNPKDCAISLALETAEVLEHFQWKSPKEIKKHLREDGERVAEEIADVLYWILLIAYDLSVDLPTAFEKKMLQNEKKYPIAKARGKHTKYSKL